MIKPDRIDALVKMPPPTPVKEVRSLLRSFSFFRRFIRNFSEITLPLTRLLKKDAKFIWDQLCQNSLEIVREKISNLPILVYPVFQIPFEILRRLTYIYCVYANST